MGEFDLKKRLFSLLLCFLIMITVLSTTAFATASVVVSAKDVPPNQSSVLVPVNIASDKHLMGLKITVEYPHERVVVNGVTRGSVTAKGNFNTNFGAFDGEFTILWNNTEEVLADGTLFVLTIDTTSVTAPCEIKLSYSQPDTFDGDYKDVALECKNILVAPEKSSGENADTTANEPTGEAPVPEFDGSQVADSVNNVLENNNYGTIYDVENKEEFLEKVNSNMGIILGVNDTFFSDFNDLISTYESYYNDSFIFNVVTGLDSSEIQSAINAALDENGAKSLDNIKNKSKFIATAEEKFKEVMPDIQKMSDYVSEDVAFRTIEELYNTASKTNDIFSEDKESEKDVKKTDYKYVYIILSVLLLFVFVGILGVIIMKKIKKSKSENAE